MSRPPFARSWMQYDSLSRLSVTWRDEQATKGERFGYDAIGQLISAKYNADQVWTGNPLNPTRTVNYNTDVLNRTGSNGVNENGMLTAYTPNPMNQYTVVGGQTPNYDSNFNLFVMSGWVYNYDAEKRMTGAANPSPRATFLYDGLGRCVKRTIDGATTLLAYDGWKPIVEWDGNGNLVAWNIYGAGADEILWRYQSGVGHLRYKSDRQGNVMFLLNYSGGGLEKYTYDAFGQPTVTNWDGSGARTWSNYGNRFMFTGREWLAALGLYDYRARMYQPQLGRFLQPDPLGFGGGDPNLFRYCGGDPVNWTDPSGLITVYGRPLNTEHREAPTGPAPGPFGPSGGIQFGGGVGAYAGGQTLEGYVDSHRDDPPGGNAFPRVTMVAGPPATIYFSAPGSFVFGAGSSPGIGSGNPFGWDRFYRFLNTPATPEQTAWTMGPYNFFRDHLSVDVNVNTFLAGGNLGHNATGTYGSLGAGPGAGPGEATLTVNFNIGEVPRGAFAGVDGAFGNGIAGRFSAGFSDNGGWYFSFGAGLGYAAYFGSNGGGGGYINGGPPGE